MTSIEWLESKLPTAFKELTINKELFKQAKEMHKKEIEESYSEGQNEGSNRASSFDWGVRIKEVTAEQYYNETFKQQ